MNECSFITETPSAKISVCLKYTEIPSDGLFAYKNTCTSEKRCEQGCPNYNNKWSCPPHSPKYSAISKNYNNAYIFIFYCYLEQFSYIKIPYMKIQASNSILRSKSDKIMRQLEKELDGKILTDGSCHLCRSCSCKTKESTCKKPSQMRYSMESVGLNVEKIAMDFFSHELLRYSKNTSPQYSSVVITILTNKTIDEDQVNKLISNINKL